MFNGQGNLNTVFWEYIPELISENGGKPKTSGSAIASTRSLMRKDMISKIFSNVNLFYEVLLCGITIIKLISSSRLRKSKK